MRPVDEFRAFARLADEGLTAEEIALRFGQTVRFVQGRMALGRLHTELLELLDKDDIRLDVAMAYTLEPDPKRQIEIYNNLPGYQKTSTHYIKEAIAGTGIKSNGQVAKFIGETRYIVAGGKIMHDLFEDHSFWISTDIIEKLRVERLAEVKEELLAAGWAFVKTADELGNDYWNMRRLHPEENALSPEQKERMEYLAEQLEQFDEDGDDEDYRAIDEELEELKKLSRGVHSAEQRAGSGVVIRTDRSYELEYGMVPPGSKSSSSSSGKPDKDPLAISAPVLSEMGKAATAALAEAVATQQDKALAMLAAMLELAPVSPWQGHRPGRLKLVAPGDTSGAGYSGQTAKRSYSEAFEAYAAMTADELKSALARLVSGVVDVSQEWLSSNPKMRKATLETFGVDPTPHFDVDGFFSAARKPIISAAFKEITGQDLKDGKKADMVALTEDVAKKTGWLPEYLRTAAYKSQVPPAAAPKRSRSKQK